MLDRRESLRREYVHRVNLVMDYVRDNLGGDLSLARLAREASFSPFHFHRIFRALTGETLSDFIRRVRLERACAMLSGNPLLPITTIALGCGFSGSAAFARAFRDRFGVTASRYRQSKSRKPLRKHGKARAPGSGYAQAVKSKRQRSPTMKVEVKTMPELHVAYIRNTGPYNTIGRAFERLMKWAGPRGLLRFPQTTVLGVYHDSPDITEADKLRADACITVPQDTQVSGEVGTRLIPGGRYAVARCEVAPGEFQAVWDGLMRDWLPESGYQPDDRPCYEIYYNNPEEHPEYKFIVDICEPVRPL